MSEVKTDSNNVISHLLETSQVAVDEQVSASTQTQALCAIVFLYHHVMNKDIGLAIYFSCCYAF